MISAEMITARVKELAARFRFPFRSQKPAVEPVPPVEDEPDEFQKGQAAKLVNIFQRIRASGGTLVENGTHTIPLVHEVHSEHKPR